MRKKPMSKETAKESIPVLKSGTTRSLSNLSELAYEIGLLGEAIQIRVTANSGKGQFNKDWIALEQIETLITSNAGDKPMYSSVLRPAYEGKSFNSPAFLFECLL
jgi:hypothetical protein